MMLPERNQNIRKTKANRLPNLSVLALQKFVILQPEISNLKHIEQNKNKEAKAKLLRA